MKKILPGLFLVLCISCNESGVKVAKPATFVRYFNGGTPDVAQSIIKATVLDPSQKPVSDGYVILANSQTALTSTYYRIKLIRIDNYGNQVWQSLLPAVPDGSATAPNYKGYGITAIIDNTGADIGYFIVGEEIYDDPAQNNNRTQGLLMIQVDTKGAVVKTATLPYSNIGVPVRGVGVTRAKNGNFYVLGEAQSGTTDMFLAEVDGSTLSPVWTRSYGAATTTLVNRVFTYGDSIYWGGTRTVGSSQDMRWISTQINSASKFDVPYPSSQASTPPPGNIPINYTCNDICNFGFGYGFVGSYSLSPGVFNRIAFFRVNENGQQVDSTSYPLKFPQQAPYQAGNSICATLDGGFLILGTSSTDVSTSDTNYLLIKTDAHGTPQWTKEYGGRYIDIGAKVLQADDGGYIVLGTTNLANVESVFLMKTDSNGNIQ